MRWGGRSRGVNMALPPNPVPNRLPLQLANRQHLAVLHHQLVAFEVINEGLLDDVAFVNFEEI